VTQIDHDMMDAKVLEPFQVHDQSVAPEAKAQKDRAWRRVRTIRQIDKEKLCEGFEDAGGPLVERKFARAQKCERRPYDSHSGV